MKQNEVKNKKVKSLKTYLARDNEINTNILLHLLHEKDAPKDCAIRRLAKQANIRYSTSQKIIDNYERSVVKFLVKRELRKVVNHYLTHTKMTAEEQLLTL